MGTGQRDELGLPCADAITERGAWTSTHDEGDHNALTALCRLAMYALEADDASIGVLRAGRFTPWAATSDRARLAEALLELGGRGPGPSPDLGETFRVGEAGVEQQWPELAGRLTDELGIHGVLVHFVQLRGSAHAVLVLYASQPAAFRREHQAKLSAFGRVANAVIGSDLEWHRAAHLQRAVLTNRRIGAALGVVMATQQVDLDEAWQLLVAASQGLNIKAADLAEQVICTGTLPGGDRSRTAHGT